MSKIDRPNYADFFIFTSVLFISIVSSFYENHFDVW